jgi:glutamate N-acetyltransferase/amino-acid N-acetyltransferase
MNHALSEASLPRGFRFSATACGLKKTGALDLAIISSDVPASAAAVFTQNLVVAPPVLVSKGNLRASKGRMRGVVVNAGNANCATGADGYAAAQRTVAEAAKRLNCKPEELFVCSTGVIGVPLALDKILRRLPLLARHRRPSARSFAEFSLAICTTDTRPKTAAASFKMAGKRVHLVGCAKGAGMIHPNMATTLAFVATDAAIAPALLQKTLREVTARTFNSISIDGDTSTNDTLLVLANGEAGAPSIQPGSRAYRAFIAALEQVCHSLALQIVADGEGAQRVIEIVVRGIRGSGPELGPRLRGGRPCRRAVRYFAGGHHHGRHSRARPRQAARLQRTRRQQSSAGRPCADRHGLARGPRERALLDLRLHGGIRPHQCQLSHLTGAGRSSEG